MPTRKTALRSIVIGSLLLFGLTACRQRASQDVAHHAQALVVFPGAKAAKWVNFGDTDQLSYQVQIEYPANGVVSYISDQLQGMGWRPLEEDYWNPGLPASQVRGWTHFVDATVHPPATVDAWAGQWQNHTGDLVWYDLRYSYPPGDRYTLSVHAGFIPADRVKQTPKRPEVPK